MRLKNFPAFEESQIAIELFLEEQEMAIVVPWQMIGDGENDFLALWIGADDVYNFLIVDGHQI